MLVVVTYNYIYSSVKTANQLISYIQHRPACTMIHFIIQYLICFLAVFSAFVVQAHAGCREDQTTTTYGYQYPWPKIPDGTTRFTFKLRANNDGHVALAAEPSDSSDLVEIVIGGWYNQQSAIRSCKKCQSLVINDTSNLLSPDTDVHFYISFKGGLVEVGIVDKLPFMAYQFNYELTVNYIGISTGWESTGLWTFCGFGTDDEGRNAAIDAASKFGIAAGVIFTFIIVYICYKQKQLRTKNRQVTFGETILVTCCGKSLETATSSTTNGEAQSDPSRTNGEGEGNAALPSYQTATETNSDSLHGVPNNIPLYSPDMYVESAHSDPNLPPPSSYDGVISKADIYRVPEGGS